MVQQLFKELFGKQGIFKTEKPLLDGYMPENLLFNGLELLKIADYFKRQYRGEREPGALLLLGPEGAGKTVTARYAAREFGKFAECNLPVKVITQYIDCKKKTMLFQIFFQLATDQGIEIKKKTFPRTMNAGELQEELNRKNRHLILVLDNVLYLKNKNVRFFLDLARKIPEWISVILISNSKLEKDLMNEVRRIVVFRPYSRDELSLILSSITGEVFCTGTVTTGAHDRTVAISEEMGLKEALAFLAGAGLEAESDNSFLITERHLQKRLLKEKNRPVKSFIVQSGAKEIGRNGKEQLIAGNRRTA